LLYYQITYYFYYMIYNNIIHKNFKEEYAFNKYIQSKKDCNIMWFDYWLDWLNEKNKDHEILD